MTDQDDILILKKDNGDTAEIFLLDEYYVTIKPKRFLDWTKTFKRIGNAKKYLQQRGFNTDAIQ